MEIREIHPFETESARRLLEAGGWSHRVSNPDDFRELVSRSQRALVAVQDGAVILTSITRPDGTFLQSKGTFVEIP